MAFVDLDTLLKKTDAKVVSSYRLNKNVEALDIKMGDLFIPTTSRANFDFILEIAMGKHRKNKELMRFFEFVFELQKFNPLFTTYNHFFVLDLIDKDTVIVEMGILGEDEVVTFGVETISPNAKDLHKILRKIVDAFYDRNLKV